MSDMNAAIATAAIEQSHSVSGVADSFTELEGSNHQNMSLVERVAKQSARMFEEARTLKEAISFFRIDATSGFALAAGSAQEAGQDFFPTPSPHG